MIRVKWISATFRRVVQTLLFASFKPWCARLADSVVDVLRDGMPACRWSLWSVGREEWAEKSIADFGVEGPTRCPVRVES